MKKIVLIFGLLIALLAVLALVVTGRTGAAGGPTVDLVSVHFQEATLLETTVTFTLRLSNEQPAPRTFSGSVHKMYLNGLYVGKGLSDATITVPRLATVTNDVTVHLSNLALATRIKAVIHSQSFDYRITSLFYGQNVFDRCHSEAIGKLSLSDFMPTDTNAVPAQPEPPVTEAPAGTQPEPPANP